MPKTKQARVNVDNCWWRRDGFTVNHLLNTAGNILLHKRLIWNSSHIRPFFYARNKIVWNAY